MSYRISPEWAPQRAIWTAWPAHADLWLEDLEPARGEVGAMIRAIAADQVVELLVMGDESMASARAALGDLPNVHFVDARYGDIWVRDTGPVFAWDDQGGKVAHNFGFNFWGNRFDLPFDPEVGALVADAAGVRRVDWDFVLEGGSMECDGAGRILTTRQCLLNPNRNPNLSQADIETRLRSAWGADQIFWLDEGLLNDHTDGHIDNIARFVGPGRVVCQKPSGDDDANAATLGAIADQLRAFGLDVIEIPSPGLITDDDGEPIPASHMNFIIGNKTVVMPTYEDMFSKQAVEALQAVFPGRNVIGMPTTHILTGGGSFHCITQQEPA